MQRRLEPRGLRARLLRCNASSILLVAALTLLPPVFSSAVQPSIHRFPRPQDPTAAAGLERNFAAIEREHSRQALDCWRQAKAVTDSAAFSQGVGFGYEVRYRVLFEDAGIFSVAETSEVFCAGPYPASSVRAHTFALRSAQPYDPLQLYRISVPGAKPVQLLPEVEVALRARLLASLKRNGLRAECADIVRGDLHLRESGAFGLTRRGLIYFPDPPHAVQACYEPVVLPYADLKRFIDAREAARVGWGR